MLAPVKNLEINKGNSGHYIVKLVDQDNNAVVLEDDAMIYFTVKDSSYAEDYVFQKRLGDGITYQSTDNTYKIDISCDDTDPLFYKDYFYDITIVRNVGEGSASINKEKMTVLVGDYTIGHVATFKVNEVSE